MKKKYIKPFLKAVFIESEDKIAVSVSATMNPNDVLDWNDGFWN